MAGNDIKFRISAVDDFSRQMKHFQKSVNNMSDSTQKMANDMRKAYNQTKAVMDEFKGQQMGVEYGFFKLGQSSDQYAGKTNDLMNEIKRLGKEQKTVNDNMIKANGLLKAELYETAGEFLNLSTQASKISDNYTRMANPIYNVNKASLAAADGMNKLANSGNAAVLAIKLLGPTANMKQLLDMQGMITQGLTRFAMVAMAAAVTSGVLYSSLFKAAKGPDPSEVYKKQAEALANYAEEVKNRTQEIAEAWNLFENIKIEDFSGKQLTRNLQEQVTALVNWRGDLADIAQHAGQDFANYLAQMGPAAAGEVRAIAEMTAPELAKYVALWKEKMAQAKGQATTELEQLKKQTDLQVKKLQESLTPLGLALEPMKKAWASAVEPMVQAFTLVSVPIVNFLTLIGQMITKFNEAHPVLALIIQGIMMLVPILTLLLSPLAIGIGLVAGFHAAWAYLWTLIGPLVTGLAAMSATVWIVAAAIVGLVAAFVIAYNKIAWFREAVDAAWAGIKSAFMTALAAIKSVVVSVMSEVASFFASELKEIRSFWDENGKAIMQVVTIAMAFIAANIRTQMAVIQAIFTVVWNVIKSVTVGLWNAIKGVISGAIQVILGIIKTFVSALKGDWKGAWDGVVQITKGAIEILKSIVKGTAEIGKNIINGLVNGIKSAAGQLYETARSIASKVTSTIKGALDINSPSRVMMNLGEFTGIGLAKGMTNTLGTITKSAMGMANATIAPIKRNSSGASTVNKTTNNTPISITLNYSGSASRDDVMTMANLLDAELANRFRHEARISGVKGV